MAKFQSTPPARGATARTPAGSPRRLDFNPRPPRGGRPFCSISLTLSAHFNPRPPRGGRLAAFLLVNFSAQISIHAPREGGDFRIPLILFRVREISIHAPREGGDNWVYTHFFKRVDISIHAPREGGDSVRTIPVSSLGYFNPRPPRGGRQQRCTVLPADL